MESRQKLAKRLVGLRFADQVTLPASLWLDDHEAGVVTSVVHSPALGWIGLGILEIDRGSGSAGGTITQ